MYKSTGSFFNKFELILNCATLAAHSSAQGKSFRQKDVFFFFELFNNWCSGGLWQNITRYQNTQIARYLEQLAQENYSKKSSANRRPDYRLSRGGLIELLARITGCNFNSPEQFFFAYYFISNYKNRLIDLVKSEGALFPVAMRIELEGLLEEKELLKNELKRQQKAKLKITDRIKDAFSVLELSENSLRKGIPVRELVHEIQQKYPYELNNQKPLSELVSGIPADQQLWEISEGAGLRAKQIWQPVLKLMDAYIENLKSLQKE